MAKKPKIDQSFEIDSILEQRDSRLMEVLKNLPEESQFALRLRYFERLPSKEIAKQLGKTDGATRVLLTRSLAKLRAMLRRDSDSFSFVAPSPPRDPS
jgi:RNA polymerase sigma factor (sigma-70 family)